MVWSGAQNPRGAPVLVPRAASLPESKMPTYVFDEFELDTARFELRRNGAPCPLEPQVFSVLAFLVEQRDRMVSKHDLMDHIWHDRYISESALTSRVKAARKALGDSGSEQRFIRTVYGRGYRFVAPVTLEPAARTPSRAPAGDTGASTPRIVSDVSTRIFGRDRELARLRKWYEAAVTTGRRQVVFVTGDAGRGKSSVIDAFVASVAGSDARIAVGRCAQHRGAGEPYMAAIEAMSDLCTRYGDAVTHVIAMRAPAWLVQAPSLLGGADGERLRERVVGNTSGRMLREAAAAIEELSGKTPLVLVLEDLHWADGATLDLVGWLARRPEAARLLLIGSYRPAEGSEAGVAALQRDLRLRGLCEELALPPLGAEAVAAFVASRFEGIDAADDVGAALLRRTEGHPLFMHAVADAWQAAGSITRSRGQWRLATGATALASGVPETLRGVIDDQVERLSPGDRQLLELAAVAGSPFSAAALAAALDKPVDAIESRCEDLRRRGEMLVRGSDAHGWPARTIAGSYAFAHSMYEEAIYEGIPPGRRALLHRRIGEALERAAGEHAEAHAVALARHAALADDVARAVRYARPAAEQAMTRGAHREAAVQLEHAVDLLRRLPPGVERDLAEAELQSLLGTSMIASKGFGSPEAEQAYGRALALTASIPASEHQTTPTLGLAALLEFQGKHAGATDLLRTLESIDDARRDERISYHALLSCSRFHQGAFAEALEFGERGIRLQRPEDVGGSFAYVGDDAMFSCRAWAAVSLWFLGRADLALARMDALLDDARREGRRYAYASALCHRARINHLRREPAPALEAAEEAARVAAEYGFAYYAAVAAISAGWARAMLGTPEEGILQVRQGIEAHKGTGAQMDRPYYLGLLAEAQARAGDRRGAQATLDEALAFVAEGGSQFFFAAELLRMRGALDPDPTEGAARMRQAIALARAQGAIALELRAALSLAALSAHREEARAVIASLLPRFPEEAETSDLREARTLLRGGAAPDVVKTP